MTTERAIDMFVKRKILSFREMKLRFCLSEYVILLN